MRVDTVGADDDVRLDLPASSKRATATSSCDVTLVQRVPRVTLPGGRAAAITSSRSARWTVAPLRPNVAAC
jgi:hypothetical protein